MQKETQDAEKATVVAGDTTKIWINETLMEIGGITDEMLKTEREVMGQELVASPSKEANTEAEEAGINQGVIGTKQEEQVDMELSRLETERVTRIGGHTWMSNMIRDRDSHPTNTSVTRSTGRVHMRIRNVKASLKMRGPAKTR